MSKQYNKKNKKEKSNTSSSYYSKDALRHGKTLDLSFEEHHIVELSLHDKEKKYPEQANHELEFRNEDTFDCMRYCQKELKLNPVGMNMASQFCPGGGWMRDKVAQEESLFYRSSYWVSLNNARYAYPLNDKVIYSPKIEVFADSNYEKLNRSNRFIVSMIAVAALRKPRLDNNGKFSKKQMKETKNRIRNFLLTALENGHDCVVLGALGTGAYSNPVSEIIKAFQFVLYIEGLGPKFKRVVFAILPGKVFNPLPSFRNGIIKSKKCEKRNK